jgi:hypothetical protein
VYAQVVHSGLHKSLCERRRTAPKLVGAVR